MTQIIEPAAAGNRRVTKGPILWSAYLTLHDLVVYDTVFAVIQLAIAVVILWPTTTKPALVASIV